MNNDTVYIIFRRVYHEDDLDYGTFRPLYVTLNQEKCVNVFNNICNAAHNDPLAKEINEVLLSSIEYSKNSWRYEYHLERYMMDKFCTVENIILPGKNKQKFF